MLRIESFVCTWKSWSTCKVPDPVLQAMAKAKAGRGVCLPWFTQEFRDEQAVTRSLSDVYV